MKKTLIERGVIGYTHLPVRTKGAIWIAFLTVLFLLIPAALREREASRLDKARIYFNSTRPTVSAGTDFPVELRLQTTGTAINAVSAYVRFNPQVLQVIQMTTEKSFCTFYLDNTFDNIKGEVNLSCGLANPGFQGDSVIVHLTMRARVVGSASITLDKDRSRVLANDGRGSDVTDSLPALSFNIQQLL